MGANSKIGWTNNTWNPVTGCTQVSPGCDNCYAKRMATRLRGRCGYPADDPFRLTLHPSSLTNPLRWRKPRRVFVCSMGDLFHADVPDEMIAMVFAVMCLCPQHTFQVLTKRPGRMRQFLSRGYADVCAAIHALGIDLNKLPYYPLKIDDPGGWPLPNVWLGVTAENQEQAAARIHLLLRTPAAVRFVSVEPMLGAVDLTSVKFPHGGYENVLRCDVSQRAKCAGIDKLNGIDWVICGGESGPKARPMHPDWATALRDQCQEARVPFYFKQWGNKAAGRVLDGRTWDEFPEGEEI